MRGRPPKSNELKALQGDTRRKGSRKAKAEVKATAAKESAPAETPPVDPMAPPPEVTGRAADIWKRDFFSIVRDGFVKATDLQLFALYCRELARYETLDAIVAQNNGFYETTSKHGKMLRKHPAVDLRDKALAMVMKMQVELNLTPKSWMQTAAARDARQLMLPLMPGRDGVKQPKPQAEADSAPQPSPSETAAGNLSSFLAGNPSRQVH